MSSDTETAIGRPRTAIHIRIWLILICGIAGAAGGLVHARRTPKAYNATAQLLFDSNSGVLSVFGGSSAASSSAQPEISATNTGLASLPVVFTNTVRALGDRAPDGFSVHVTPSGTSNLVEVTATARTASGAALGANAYAQQFLTYSQQQQNQGLASAIRKLKAEIAAQPTTAGSASSSGTLTNLEQTLGELEAFSVTNPLGVSIAQTATAPSSPSEPRTTRELALGALLGVVVGFIAALLAGWADPRLLSPDDLRTDGSVIVDSGGRRTRKRGVSPQFATRVLRATRSRTRARTDQTLCAVTCADDRRDIASASGLALALASAAGGESRPAAIVDLAGTLGKAAPVAKGKSDGQEHESRKLHPQTLQAETRNLPEGPIDLYGVGRDALLDDQLLADLIREVQGKHDYVFVNAPGLEEFSSAASVLMIADAVVFTARLRRSSRRRVDAALAQILAVRAEGIVSVPLRGRERSVPGRSPYISVD